MRNPKYDESQGKMVESCHCSQEYCICNNTKERSSLYLGGTTLSEKIEGKLKEIGMTNEEFEERMKPHNQMALYLQGNGDFETYIESILQEFLENGKL